MEWNQNYFAAYHSCWVSSLKRIRILPSLCVWHALLSPEYLKEHFLRAVCFSGHCLVTQIEGTFQASLTSFSFQLTPRSPCFHATEPHTAERDCAWVAVSVPLHPPWDKEFNKYCSTEEWTCYNRSLLERETTTFPCSKWYITCLLCHEGDAYPKQMEAQVCYKVVQRTVYPIHMKQGHSLTIWGYKSNPVHIFCCIHANVGDQW